MDLDEVETSRKEGNIQKYPIPNVLRRVQVQLHRRIPVPTAIWRKVDGHESWIALNDYDELELGGRSSVSELRAACN